MASSCEAMRLNQTSVKTAQSHHHCLYMQGQSSWFQALNMVWSKTEVSREWRTSDQAKNCVPGSSGLWGASACAEVRVRRKILFYNCLGKLYLGTSGDYRKVNLCHFKLLIIMLGDHCPGEKKTWSKFTGPTPPVPPAPPMGVRRGVFLESFCWLKCIFTSGLSKGWFNTIQA